MLKQFIRASFCISLTMLLTCTAVFASGNEPKRARRSQEPLRLIGKAVGPTEEMVKAARSRAEQSEAVRRELGGKKYSLIGLEYIDNGTPRPTNFRIIFYDYTDDRTLVAEGDFAGKMPVTVHEEMFQPIPSDEEFAEAVRIVGNDPVLGASLKNSSLKAFRPMPDITVLSGTIERLVNVGLDNGGSTGRNEVVSVSIKRGSVIRYPDGAPSQSRATPDACGIPNAGQSTTSRGTAGSADLTVMQGSDTLWQMNITRPSASSGTRASGIELQNVRYRGKLVLKRAHTPVLNVQYVAGGCGPYRDWQYQEDMFQTPAAGNNDIAPGIRIVAAGQVATTALESGNDTGNFRGVAVYTQGTETVLVSELQAGWYRYIVEYRFAADGIIRPRYGFGATDNSCVCDDHNHHVYWRFDFDIVSPSNRVYQVERGRKFLQPITNELFRNKSAQTNRSILVQNSAGNEAYMLIPNNTDGIVDTFGVHDLWVLRYKTGTTPVTNEFDDGINCTTCSTAFIQIDGFANNESVVDQDVVVWYGAHFLHTDDGNVMNPSRSPEILSGSHVVGPDIRPIRW